MCHPMTYPTPAEIQEAALTLWHHGYDGTATARLYDVAAAMLKAAYGVRRAAEEDQL